MVIQNLINYFTGNVTEQQPDSGSVSRNEQITREYLQQIDKLKQVIVTAQQKMAQNYAAYEANAAPYATGEGIGRVDYINYVHLLAELNKVYTSVENQLQNVLKMLSINTAAKKHLWQALKDEPKLFGDNLHIIQNEIRQTGTKASDLAVSLAGFKKQLNADRDRLIANKNIILEKLIENYTQNRGLDIGQQHQALTEFSQQIEALNEHAITNNDVAAVDKVLRTLQGEINNHSKQRQQAYETALRHCNIADQGITDIRHQLDALTKPAQIRLSEAPQMIEGLHKLQTTLPQELAVILRAAEKAKNELTGNNSEQALALADKVKEVKTEAIELLNQQDIWQDKLTAQIQTLQAGLAQQQSLAALHQQVKGLQQQAGKLPPSNNKEAETRISSNRKRLEAISNLLTEVNQRVQSAAEMSAAIEQASYSSVWRKEQQQELTKLRDSLGNLSKQLGKQQQKAEQALTAAEQERNQQLHDKIAEQLSSAAEQLEQVKQILNPSAASNSNTLAQRIEENKQILGQLDQISSNITEAEGAVHTAGEQIKKPYQHPQRAEQEKSLKNFNQEIKVLFHPIAAKKSALEQLIIADEKLLQQYGQLSEKLSQSSVQINNLKQDVQNLPQENTFEFLSDIERMESQLQQAQQRVQKLATLEQSLNAIETGINSARFERDELSNTQALMQQQQDLLSEVKEIKALIAATRQKLTDTVSKSQQAVDTAKAHQEIAKLLLGLSSVNREISNCIDQIQLPPDEGLAAVVSSNQARLKQLKAIASTIAQQQADIASAGNKHSEQWTEQQTQEKQRLEAGLNRLSNTIKYLTANAEAVVRAADEKLKEYDNHSQVLSAIDKAQEAIKTEFEQIKDKNLKIDDKHPAAVIEQIELVKTDLSKLNDLTQQANQLREKTQNINFKDDNYSETKALSERLQGTKNTIGALSERLTVKQAELNKLLIDAQEKVGAFQTNQRLIKEAEEAKVSLAEEINRLPAVDDKLPSQQILVNPIVVPPKSALTMELNSTSAAEIKAAEGQPLTIEAQLDNADAAKNSVQPDVTTADVRSFDLREIVKDYVTGVTSSNLRYSQDKEGIGKVQIGMKAHPVTILEVSKDSMIARGSAAYQHLLGIAAKNTDISYCFRGSEAKLNAMLSVFEQQLAAEQDPAKKQQLTAAFNKIKFLPEGQTEKLLIEDYKAKQASPSPGPRF